MNGILNCGKHGLPQASSCAMRSWVRLLAHVLVAVGLFLNIMTAFAVGPYGATQCLGSRNGSSLGCTANDVQINTITVVGTPPSSCVGGQTIPLDLSITMNFGSAKRYNIGVFISNDGKLPQNVPPGGAGTCSVAILPIGTFMDYDGNTCGDGKQADIGGGTGIASFTMTGVAVPCTTDGLGSTNLYIPYAISWEQSAGTPASCLDNTYPMAGAVSKCNTGSVTPPPGGIVVLPGITITDAPVVTAKSGDVLTYTVVITNTTGSALNGAVFTDPAVANLSVSNVVCAAGGGATCPGSSTVAAMQGAGISLPNMPFNGTLTFTITGTVGTVTTPATLTNTARVTVSGQTYSASDSDTLYALPTVSKSFSPGTIASGGTSTLTITLANPNAIAITGAAFTDNYPTGMTNSGTPTLTNSCGGTATAVASGSSLSLSGGTIPVGGSCTVTVQVTTTATVVNSTGTVTTTNVGNSSGASATLSFSIPVSSFNTFETSTVANAISGSIYTKLAGTAFDLDVVAISGASQSVGFSGNVKVELLANTGTPGSGYGADNCPTSNSVFYTIASTAIASGRSTAHFLAASFSPLANAYRDVRVRISYPTVAPTISICSTDSFAIRPVAFTVTSSNATNTGTSGSPTIKAGANFNLTATAVAGYNGTPSLDATQVVGTSTAGTLSGSFGAAISGTGVATGNSFTYSEVGNFGLKGIDVLNPNPVATAVYDATFTSVDPASDCTADFSNTLVGGKYGCKIGSAAVAQTTGSSGFGRFVPDHFDTIVTPGMPCPTGLSCPTLIIANDQGFVYSGQAFTTQVIARNLAGVTTINYGSAPGYSKVVTLSAWDAVGGATTNPGGGALTLNTVPSTSFSNGVATTSAPLYTFPTTPVAPTDIYMRAMDTDGVTSLRATSVEGGIKIVSGRVKISNVNGSELLPLTMTAAVQYWNGTSWATSTTDNTTAFNTNLSTGGGNVVATIVTGLASGVSVASAGAVTVASGVKTFTLNKPGVTGSADISLNAPSYLLAGSNGAAVNPSIAGRATFGVYKGNNDFIYLRESY